MAYLNIFSIKFTFLLLLLKYKHTSALRLMTVENKNMN